MGTSNTCLAQADPRSLNSFDVSVWIFSPSLLNPTISSNASIFFLQSQTNMSNHRRRIWFAWFAWNTQLCCACLLCSSRWEKSSGRYSCPVTFSRLRSCTCGASVGAYQRVSCGSMDIYSSQTGEQDLAHQGKQNEGQNLVCCDDWDGARFCRPHPDVGGEDVRPQVPGARK